MAYPNTNWNQITAITQDLIIPKLYDNITDSNMLFKKLEVKKEMKDGGNKIRVPLTYALGAYGGWYSGMDTLNTTDTDMFTNLEFDWKQIHEPIVISGRDEAINGGTKGILQLVKEKTKMAQKTIRNTIGTGLYNAGTTTDAILGARLFCSTSSTYGGISQTTYSWLQSNVDTSTTMSISAMQGLWGDCNLDNEYPDLIMSTQDNYDRYYLTLQPQQRFADDKIKSGGFTSLKFNQADVVVDSHVPSGYMLFFNTEYLHLFGLDGNWFRFRPFQTPDNQDGKIAHIFTYLALACSSPARQGVFTSLAA